MSGFSSSTSQKQKTFLAELAAVLVLTVAVVLPFLSGVSPGFTLSKLSLIKEVDFLQCRDLDGHIDISSDPSAAICHAPTEIFAKTISGGLPLWNNLSGCGRPVIGDFQALLFSFFHRLFPVTSSNLYSLGILFKILVSALGAYCLARLLGVSRLAAMAAGFAFALCPRCLFFDELCNNYCFYPWMMACAVWASTRFSLHRSVILGLVLAGFGYNMHPETFVIGSAAALALAFLRTAFGAESSFFAGKQQTAKSLVWVMSIAMLTFLISAPLILPFCEFVANGASYKFHDISNVKIDFMDMFSYFYNLSLPFSTSSPCVGPILAVLCLPGIVFAWRSNRSILLLFIAALLFSSRPGPLENWLSVRPISYLLPEYTIYLSVLLSCVIGAIGLDGFGSGKAVPKKVLGVCALLMVILAGLLIGLQFWQAPSQWFCEFWSDKTDWAYLNKPIDGTFAVLGLYVLGVVLVLSIAKTEWMRRWCPPLTALTVFIVANSIPLFLYSSKALPSTKAFWYQPAPIISRLRELQENSSYRSTATGCWIYQPNSNLVFGTSDLRCTAPLHPKRYSNFIELAGIHSRYCNIYESPCEFNHLFNLASVKYVLSNAPLAERDAEASSAKKFTYDQPSKIVPGIRLERADLFYFPRTKEISGKVLFTVHRRACAINICRLKLIDDQGKRIWPKHLQLEGFDELALDIGGHHRQMPINLALPPQYEGKINVVLQIGQYLGEKIKGPEIVLARIDAKFSSGLPPRGRFVRVPAPDEYLRIYENTKALPPAYLVHSIQIANGEKQALELLKANRLDWSHSAIIEGNGSAAIPPSATASNDNAETKFSNETLRILQKDSDSVSLYAVTKSPCYALLTDTFYPGWQAYVDGKLSNIYPANYAFRAVYLPNAGQHHITFVYNPDSFNWGSRLMLLGLAISLGLLLSSFGRHCTRLLRGGRSDKLQRVDSQELKEKQKEHITV